MGSSVRLRAFGDPVLVSSGGGHLDEVTRKTRRFALLIYLTCQGRGEAHQRDEIVATFWPESDEARGRNALRQALFEPYRVPLDNEGAPALGPDDASVTMTEFSDFQCPYCGQFFPTVKRLEEEFGDDLKIVFRQFPLNVHPHAQKAAEASLCAPDQGKFWEMHDLMFLEQDRLSVADLKEKASRLGMDQQEFDDCLDSGRHVERIQEDQKEGTRVGVDGTPAIFLNGVPLPGGAVSYEVAAKAIREAIDRARR